MKRLLLLSYCFGVFAHAQSFTLAASGDGEILQFATNLWLKGDPFIVVPAPPGQTSSRIYQHATPPILQLTASFGRVIIAPFVCTDGLTQGTLNYTPCIGGSCILTVPRDLVTLKRAGQEFEFLDNLLRVSRNGRFVFDAGSPNLDPIPTLRDLDTGKSYELGRVLPRHPSQSLSDGGTLLSTEPGAVAGIGDLTKYTKILLTPLGQTPELLFEGGKILSAAITAKGNFAFVLQESPAAHFRLLEIDLATRTPRQLWEGDTQPLGISPNTDGRRVVMQTAQQVLLWDRTSGWRSLFSHDAGVRSTLLTDNGEIVFAITRVNSVYRIDANAGESQQLYAPFPLNLRQDSFGSLPGSLIRFGLDLPNPKLTFRAGGFTFPVVKAEGTIFDVQVPWEATALQGRTEVSEVISDDSPFSLRGSVTFPIDTSTPWAFTQFPPGGNRPHLVAAQADFGGLVTDENPAPAGSVIHFYLTGLGPLNRPVATGEKGPSNPPAAPLGRLACYIAGRDRVNPPARGLRLPAVIYAPNLIGVYQIDAEIPADWPVGLANVFCITKVLATNDALVPVGPAR